MVILNLMLSTCLKNLGTGALGLDPLTVHSTAVLNFNFNVQNTDYGQAKIRFYHFVITHQSADLSLYEDKGNSRI